VFRKTLRVYQEKIAMSYEPSFFEVFFTVTVGNLFGGLYKEYVDRLGLKGGEHVLDFGSGSGNPARFIAPLLKDGGRLTCVDVSKTWMDVARKRLRRYSNVEFKLGDIAALDLPGVGYDVVFVHFVLHDIDAAERPRIVQHLALKLKRDGRLFLREPLRFISQDEIRLLMRQSGLEEVGSSMTNIKTQGNVYEGVYVTS
jgi:SAM-dependent methyltransferase